ncbi:MAG: ImmA/IrrE family metallo-endopeptidase, partial [Flavobacteriales bacterium]
SPIVIVRRALDMELISKADFLKFYKAYMFAFRERKSKQSSGGDFYATAKKRLSLRFASFIKNAINEDRLLYRDAYKLTNLKGETFNKFMTQYLY